MGVLALKLFLAPAFVVGVSVVARRRGALAGGLLGGLPVVAGPILAVLAVVHGRAFGSHAASATLLGLVSLSAFVVVYARLAPRVEWPLALAGAMAAFGVGTALLSLVGTPPSVVGLLAAFASFGISIALLPEPPPGTGSAAHPAWDLPLRAFVAAAMVVALTGASSALGPHMSGLLAPFPIITTVLAAFTHAQRGAADTVRLLRGMLAGFFVFASVVFAFAVALAP